MTTEEKNVLIAIYDGYKEYTWSNPRYSDTPYYMKDGVFGEPAAKDFKYHLDWNWQIPVYSKLYKEFAEKYGHTYFGTMDFAQRYYLQIQANDVQKGFEIIVENLQWLNEQKK